MTSIKRRAGVRLLRALGFRRRRRVGAPPGTLEAHPEAPKPVVRVFGYGPDEFMEREVSDPQGVREFLGRWPVLWVDVDALGDVDTIVGLGEIFNLHRLALEDVLNVHQRAKVEQYDDYLFIVARMMTLTDRLETEQVSLFLGPEFVVTFQERPGDCFDPVRERIRHGRERLRAAHTDHLAYALLDALTDSYFPVLEEYGERLERIEDDVIRAPNREAVKRLHEARRDLLTVRRAIWPLRDAISALHRDPSPLIRDETRLYLRDLYDHTIQVMDLVETFRELASGLMDVYLSGVSNRMSEVMKVLTIIATIFIPLTFLAGVWGMNFDPEASSLNMPELRWRWGYPVALVAMASIGVGLAIYFSRKGWLGDRSQREGTPKLED